MNIKGCFGAFYLTIFFCGIFFIGNAGAFMSNEAERTAKKKIVYIYPKDGSLVQYSWTKDTFEEMFKEFKVIPVSSLRNLSGFEYIVTEQVPRNDQELQYLSNYPQDKVLLFVYETLLLHPRDHDKRYHQHYSKVFTWNDDFIDNEKYFKITALWCAFWYQIPELPTYEERKLSVFVGSLNLDLVHPFSQYGERAILTDFFEHKDKDEFHFYGHSVGGRMSYKNYMGIIPERDREGFLPKVHAIKNYKFDFCYENTKLVKGFFSERIFQSLSAGCIPIYSGITNIEEFIPKNCFIAKNDFKSYEELYTFIKTMNKETYEEYRENIRKFLASEAAYRMSTPYYIKRTREILGLVD